MSDWAGHKPACRSLEDRRAVGDVVIIRTCAAGSAFAGLVGPGAGSLLFSTTPLNVPTAMWNTGTPRRLSDPMEREDGAQKTVKIQARWMRRGGGESEAARERGEREAESAGEEESEEEAET